MVCLNSKAMDYFSKIQKLSVIDDDDRFEKEVSCTVPNASLTPAQVYQMYQRGVPVPVLPDSRSSDSLSDVYTPTDPSEVRQLAVDALQREFISYQDSLAAGHSELPPSDSSTPLQPTSPAVPPAD